MNAGIARRAACVVAAVAAVAATPAHAQGPVQLSSTPIPEDQSWSGHVLADGAQDVKPVRVSSTSGAVTNADGLLDPSKGPATLTYTAGQPAPTIVLDYGREVGGLPFFNVGGVTPSGTASTVSLRAAYSEARQYLWTNGATTLSLASAAGDANVKVGAVSNFVVGDTLKVGDETATISAVGTQSRSTTLFSGAAADATNIKVAATTGIVSGDMLRIGSDSVTVTNVGSQGRSTTLAAAATVGATNIKVASVTGLASGDTLVVEGETAIVQTVGTAGATGTGVTLTAPLASSHANGAGIQAPGSGITFTPALTSASASGAAVVDTGTGITLASPLTSAHAAGARVTGTPGAVTGDRNGNNGVGTDGSRSDTFNLSAAGTVGNANTAVQGGERFQLITLTTPGTVQLSSLGIHVRFNNDGASGYQGHFLSSDETLNKIWYAGAYTAQTNVAPIGGVCGVPTGGSVASCSRAPVILDGAKRDRRPFSGDLFVQGPTVFDSLGFGSHGSDYIRDTIAILGSAPLANGSVCGQTGNWIGYPTGPITCLFASSGAPYSMYFVINLAKYLVYSGDNAFAQSQYQVMKNELTYNASLMDPATGLSDAPGTDWDFYDGFPGGPAAQGGEKSATNMINYEALNQGSWIAAQLAAHDPGNPSAATWKADSATWAEQAADLKTAINAHLFNHGLGAYQIATSANGTHPATAVPQDANAEAINFGIASQGDVAGILAYLKNNLWGAHGPQPWSPDAGYQKIISPFVTGLELEARFRSGDDAGAKALIDQMWAQMVNEDGPYYTGTLWEKLNEDGTDVDSNASLAHGWATVPTSAFSTYLLGVQPTAPGYGTWAIAPHPGDLKWAQGNVPTPSGPIVSRWRRGDGDRSFVLTMSAPGGTSGAVTIPELGRGRTIAMDGAVVWQDGAPVGGVNAVESDGAVKFSGITGSHTFAFGTVTTSGGSTVGGSVPATLSLTLGAAPSFGAFTPGAAKDYIAGTTATVTSTAGDASLSVSDASSNATGHLVNGAFSLPQPLQARATKADTTSTAFNSLSAPLNLLSWSSPVSNDAVAIEFKQSIAANDALRTGSYAKTVTFTLSTTTP